MKVGECVSIFAENSHRWLIADQSVMKAGGHDAVRGASAPTTELDFIYENSESVGLVRTLIKDTSNSRHIPYLVLH